MYLYHYCNNNTFYKIVTKQELWMSDISRSNDYSEMKLFIPSIFMELEEVFKSKPFKFNYKNEEGLSALQLLLHETNETLWKEINNGFLTSYVVCFSRKGDLLSQWRGYADNGKGCSIGFSLKELEEYCAQSNDVIDIKKVEYINKQKLVLLIEEKATKLISHFITLRDDAKTLLSLPNITEEETQEIMRLLTMEVFERFLFDSLQYKWEDYKEENEWRMFFRSISKDEKTLFADEKDIPQWEKKYNKDYIIQHKKIEFIAKDDCIIPYFPLKLKEISSTPIKEVIFGPKNKSYIQDVNLLFEKEKLGKPKIKHSSISYR